MNDFLNCSLFHELQNSYLNIVSHDVTSNDNTVLVSIVICITIFSLYQAIPLWNIYNFPCQIVAAQVLDLWKNCQILFIDTYIKYLGPVNSHHASQALNLQTNNQAVKQTDNLTELLISLIY